MTLFDDTVSQEVASNDDDSPPGTTILRAFYMIAGAFVYAFFFYGVYLTFYPTDWTDPTAPSRSTGVIFLIVCTPPMVFTVRRWATYVPGVLGLAAFRELIIALSGDSGPRNQVVVTPRLYGLVGFIYCLAAAILASALTKRRLSPLGYVAFLLTAVALAFAAASSDEATLKMPPGAHRGGELLPMLLVTIGVLSLFAAWAYDRFHPNRT